MGEEEKAEYLFLSYSAFSNISSLAESKSLFSRVPLLPGQPCPGSHSCLKTPAYGLWWYALLLSLQAFYSSLGRGGWFISELLCQFFHCLCNELSVSSNSFSWNIVNRFCFHDWTLTNTNREMVFVPIFILDEWLRVARRKDYFFTTGSGLSHLM